MALLAQILSYAKPAPVTRPTIRYVWIAVVATTATSLCARSYFASDQVVIATNRVLGLRSSRGRIAVEYPVPPGKSSGQIPRFRFNSGCPVTLDANRPLELRKPPIEVISGTIICGVTHRTHFQFGGFAWQTARTVLYGTGMDSQIILLLWWAALAPLWLASYLALRREYRKVRMRFAKDADVR